MILRKDFIELQKSFVTTGKAPSGNLLSRYEILPRYATLDLGRCIPLRTHLYRIGRKLLNALGIIRSVNKNGEWRASLKHAPVLSDGKTILIWGLGEEVTNPDIATHTDNGIKPHLDSSAQSKRDIARKACLSLRARFASSDGVNSVSNPSKVIPVFITDQADFAFYSRLGWLVEYLPNISGIGEAYDDRKAKYLAWRYQDACVIPLSAGLLTDEQWNQLILKELC
jgi:hypothetical protein